MPVSKAARLGKDFRDAGDREPNGEGDMVDGTASRRMVLGGLAGLAACAPTGAPEIAAPHEGLVSSVTPGPDGWPVRATFIEHMGTVVPDVAEAVRFHSRLFNPAIMQERNPPLRAYVDINPGYLAFGSRPGEAEAFFDHYCVLIEDFDQPAIAARLTEEGVPQNFPPPIILFPDPDGVGVQLYQHPGGWFPTVVPGEPLVEGESVVTPHGLAHVMLNVSDLEASVAFYRRTFGPLDSREDDVVWFDFPDTRLGFRLAPAGRTPGVDHIRVRATAFDPAAMTDALTALGATVAPVETPGVLAFTDPMGLRLELGVA